MTGTHLHLLVNHLPILGSLLALPLLLLSLWRQKEPWVFGAATILLAIGGVGAVVADRTGDLAEEAVEHLPDVTESLIHEHEERAEVAVPLAVITGLLSLGVLGWSLKRKELHLPAAAVVLLFAGLTAGLAAWTGQAGGLIRHTELRRDGIAAGPPAGDIDDDDD